MSEAAAGTLARILTFVRTRKGAILKKRLTQRDAKSAKQLYRRQMFAFLQKNWSALELVDQTSWSDVASFFEWSLNNAYLRENLMRWDRFEVPSAYLPIQQTGAPGTVAQFTIAKHQNRIAITVRVSPISQNWGMLLYFKHGSAPSYTPQYVNQVNLHVLSSAQHYYFTPTQTGPQWFRVSLFSYNGERYDYPPAKFLIWS